MADDGEAPAPKSSTPGNELTQLIPTNHTNPSVFYINPQTLTVTVGPSENAIRFCGYIDETDLAKAAQLVRDACLRQEDGIRGDKYSSDLQDALSSQEQCTELDKYRKQSTNSWSTLKRVYPGIPILLPNEEDDLWRDVPDRNWHIQVRCKRRLTWLHVPMPEIFNYTTAIMRNCATQGLLHTLLRHFKQWKAHIPALISLLDKVKHYRDQFEAIYDPWNTHDKTRSLLEKFDSTFLRNTSAEELEIFSDMQMLIYDFIWNNTTAFNYRGDACSPSGLLRVLFNTKTDTGVETVMFVGMSDRLFYKDANFHPDDRPIRTIITVFFDNPWSKISDPATKMFTLAGHDNFDRVVTETWNYNRPREDKTRYSRRNRF